MGIIRKKFLQRDNKLISINIFMKKYIIILLLFNISLNAQKIGIVEKFKSNLQHAHASLVIGENTKVVEDLNYDIKPHIDSIFMNKNIQFEKIENFDFSIINGYNGVHLNWNKEIEEKLKKFCLDNGIDGLILLFSVNDPKYSIQPNRTLYKQNFDFGIITSGGIKKQLYFFNNLKILYYTVKSNRLNYPILKRDESLSITQNFKKYDEFVIDTKTKKLLNPEKVKKDFLKDFFYRIDASFNEVFREIKK